MKQITMKLLVVINVASVTYAMERRVGDLVQSDTKSIVVPLTQLLRKPGCGDWVMVRDEADMQGQYRWAQIVMIQKVLEGRSCILQYTVKQKIQAETRLQESVYVLEKLYGMRAQQPLVEARDPNAMDCHYGTSTLKFINF